MTPADVRQFRQMVACIGSLRRGTISLVAGANSLLFLRDALDVVEADWDEPFTAQVATVESAGLATGEQITAMGASYRAVVSQALDDLEALVLRQLPSGTVDGEPSE